MTTGATVEDMATTKAGLLEEANRLEQDASCADEHDRAVAANSIAMAGQSPQIFGQGDKLREGARARRELVKEMFPDSR